MPSCPELVKTVEERGGQMFASSSSNLFFSSQFWGVGKGAPFKKNSQTTSHLHSNPEE